MWAVGANLPPNFVSNIEFLVPNDRSAADAGTPPGAILSGTGQAPLQVLPESTPVAGGAADEQLHQKRASILQQIADLQRQYDEENIEAQKGASATNNLATQAQGAYGNYATTGNKFAGFLAGAGNIASQLSAQDDQSHAARALALRAQIDDLENQLRILESQ
jgi:hypothetical protein